MATAAAAVLIIPMLRVGYKLTCGWLETDCPLCTANELLVDVDVDIVVVVMMHRPDIATD